MSTHEDYYWTAGDDWQINATLLDYAGAPFDLSGTPDIRWALITEAGETVLTEADIDIVVMDARGRAMRDPGAGDGEHRRWPRAATPT